MTVERTPEDTRTYDVLVTQARLNAIATVAESYCRAAGGKYPHYFSEMMSPSSDIMKRMSGCSYVSRMDGCRLESFLLDDAWDRPIFYGVVDHQMVLQSAGPDGRFATNDDIGLPSAVDPHAEIYDLTEH